MCYSAKIWADYLTYVRRYDAHIDVEAFVALFYARLDNNRIKIPKALERSFEISTSAELAPLRQSIADFKAAQATQLEQELFQLRNRQADAQRRLQTRITKAAQEDVRIATRKLQTTLGRLADLQRSTLNESDARIYPGSYAPVLILRDGQRTIVPMRYQCRPAGKPASFDTQFPGTYNARRDNLDGFWRNLFGTNHALLVIDAFFEHVSRRDGTGTKNVILEFQPHPPAPMAVACLWSRWQAPGQDDLVSFAAITGAPPPEVAAAGHDRCIIPIAPEHIDAWLCPERAPRTDLYALLDARERFIYENRLVA